MTPPIRRATPGDAATIARLNQSIQRWHADHYPDAFYPTPDPAALANHFAERLADPLCTVFLSGDPACGYALCTVQSREASLFSPAVRRLMVDHIAVSPEARRRGHGRALLAAARELAQDIEVDEMLLDTWEANTEAHSFFRAMGFAPRRMLFRLVP